jgi:hypothetical protein
MLKPEHRLAADRRGLRYPSDLLGNKTRLARPIRYFEPRGIKIGGQFLVVVDGMPPRAPALFERGDRSQVASRDRGFQGLG